MKWRKNAIFNGNYRRELHENPSKSYDWQCIYFHLLESFVWCEISCRKLCAIIFLLSFCRTDRLTNFQFGFFPLHAFECTSWSITISVYCWIYGVRRFFLNWKKIEKERERGIRNNCFASGFHMHIFWSKNTIHQPVSLCLLHMRFDWSLILFVCVVLLCWKILLFGSHSMGFDFIFSLQKVTRRWLLFGVYNVH